MTKFKRPMFVIVTRIYNGKKCIFSNTQNFRTCVLWIFLAKYTLKNIIIYNYGILSTLYESSVSKNTDTSENICSWLRCIFNIFYVCTLVCTRSGDWKVFSVSSVSSWDNSRPEFSLQQNLNEIFPQYHMHSDLFSCFKSTTKQ